MALVVCFGFVDRPRQRNEAGELFFWRSEAPIALSPYTPEAVPVVLRLRFSWFQTKRYEAPLRLIRRRPDGSTAAGLRKMRASSAPWIV